MDHYSDKFDKNLNLKQSNLANSELKEIMHDWDRKNRFNY